MAKTPYTHFRLRQHTLDDLAALAACKGGVMSDAVRDAIHYWRRLVEQAGRRNAEEFTRDDWVRLAHLNRPDTMPPGVDDDSEPIARDWGQWFAAELCGMWEGRPLLPMHIAEKRECERLAKRVAKLGMVRGYAMYAALAHFWEMPTGGDGDWWTPDTWLTPTAKGG